MKSDYRSEMMRRDTNGKIDGDGIKAGQFIETGVTILAPLVVGAAITPSVAPQSLKTLGGIPEVEATTANVAQTITNIERTEPSLPVDAARKPRGVSENIPTKGDINSIRGMTKQEETSELLAKNGYDVELQPKITSEDLLKEPSLRQKKNPDFRIEGKIFDNLAIKENPLANPKNMAMNVRDSIAGKVAKGQTTRIMLNMDESKLALSDLKQVLLDNPIKNLNEIIIVKNGQISHFFPFK